MQARAFGKVILFGEHAVVHGRLALAAALDRGAVASAAPATGGSRLSMGARTITADADDDLARAFRAILEALGGDGDVHVEVRPEVPAGAGLGCSAALGVAITRAAAQVRQRSLSLDETRRIAGRWEEVFHGNPSGLDVAVATQGGVVSFRRGEAPTSVTLAHPMELVIVFTGQAPSTKSMVEHVARQLARRPEVVERNLDGIDTLARAALAALERGIWNEVGRLMDLNHALLAALLLSTEALEKACRLAREAGALGAKITGGGGGGCAIALCPGRVQPVLEALQAAGFEAFPATISPTSTTTVVTP